MSNKRKTEAGLAASTGLVCGLCEKGFPLQDGNHIPTQSLGMIPVTRCLKLPPISPDEQAWLNAKREHETVGEILDALKPLSQAERRRVLNYMWEKYVTHRDE